MRTLGRTGLEVTQLGYGTMGLRGPRTWGVRVVDDEAAERLLNQVLDSGINFLDTAPDYGLAEERIGRFLGHRRREFILATKCGCDYVQHADHLEVRHTWTADVVHRNMAASLHRLNTDYIDLMQFHGGTAQELVQSGLIEVLLDYQRQGVVRHLGVSSKLPDVETLLELDVFDCFQVPYSCLAPEHDGWLRRAVERGVGLIIRGGVAQGGPEAEIQRPHLNSVWESAQLAELLPAEMTAAQFILRSTLSHPGCQTVIVGTCNPAHLAENLTAALGGALPCELIQQVHARASEL